MLDEAEIGARTGVASPHDVPVHPLSSQVVAQKLVPVLYEWNVQGRIGHTGLCDPDSEPPQRSAQQASILMDVVEIVDVDGDDDLAGSKPANQAVAGPAGLSLQLLGECAGRDDPGRVHPQGQGRDGRTVRAHVLGEHRQPDQQEPGWTVRRFAQRRLDEAYPSLILDARYEKVRLDGVIQSQAGFIAIGINGEGRRQILGVELSNRESRSSWTTFVTSLKTRGLHGVEFVVSDDHAGLKRAVRELLPEAVWQRCYVHFLRNALDYLPRKADDDCRQELRWLYDRRTLKEAEQDLQAWLMRWATRYPKLTDWVEAHIGETLNFYSLPRQHHTHLKSTNMLERLNEEIKRRTRVVRIFPNAASCLRLVRALCAETHEGWLEDHRYLNMEFLKEQKKELRTAA